MRDIDGTRTHTRAQETAEEIASDVYAVARIHAVPAMLEALCELTGMGFAAVARVSNSSWTVCAVNDKIDFGLKVGDQLPLESTLCVESKRTGEPIVIDRASRDPRYCNHHTPKTFRIESYISVPIVLPNGHFFGNLCAVDPSPAIVSAPAIVKVFTHFASLVAFQLASEDAVDRAEIAIRAQRDASRLRNDVFTELGEHLLTPVRAISDASDGIDSRANDAAAVKGLATRIRTHTLRISSLLERLLDFSGSRDAASLRPRLPRNAARTADVPDGDAAVKSDVMDRDALESLLMQRVGELRAHLGRYDMYALAIARWVEGKAPDDSSSALLTIGTRGTWLSHRLQTLAVPEGMLAQFNEINLQLMAVLARQEIAARNSASIPALGVPGVRRFRPAAAQRDWYDHLGASDKEISTAIDAIDRDIVLVAALYLRLAGWAGRLSLPTIAR